jgi:hypothetical protein
VGSYASLHIGGVSILSVKAPVDPNLLQLFTSNDWTLTRRPQQERPYDAADSDGLVTCHELRSTPRRIRDRLAVAGIGMDLVAQVFRDLVAEHSQRSAAMLEMLSDNDLIRAAVVEEQRVLSMLTLRQWVERMSSFTVIDPSEPGPPRPHSSGWMIDLWQGAEPRLLLRACLEAYPDAAEVVLDMTDSVGGGWHQFGEDPRAPASQELRWMARHSYPVVLLTEGRSDAEILELALRVLRPHLEGFLRIGHFSQSREGSAGALANTVRAFTDAGVANRAIALFDNDTAAAEAMSTLDIKSLPDNLTVLTLPATARCRSYPTLGPNGAQQMDINGLAGSIELSLGQDTLTDPNTGELRPVQWTGRSRKLNQFQGEIVGKEAVQEAFRSKARAALKNEELRAHQDWADLERLFDVVIDVLALQTGLKDGQA